MVDVCEESYLGLPGLNILKTRKLGFFVRFTCQMLRWWAGHPFDNGIRIGVDLSKCDTSTCAAAAITRKMREL